VMAAAVDAGDCKQALSLLFPADVTTTTPCAIAPLTASLIEVLTELATDMSVEKSRKKSVSLLSSLNPAESG
jgi:hypothetical protein